MTNTWRRRIASLFNRKPLNRGIASNFRRTRLEALEDRRMLAKAADIVFLIDKSASIGTEFDWIADIVNRVNGLDDYLTDPARDIDPRYGLVGFGDGNDLNAISYGHSHLLDVNDSNSDGDKLFGTAAQLADVVVDVANPGSSEQAWDAMEHAIAEYEFRPGAAVIFVLFRRDDMGGSYPVYFVGNEPEDENQPWLTRTGTLAALNSYNVTLNSVVEATFDPAMYSTGGIVLGVEADGADWVEDGEYIAHVVNGIANRPTEPDVLVVSHNGTNSGTYVDTGKSIRISTSATAQIAGPNGGGYKAEAVAYAFDDIATTGTQITGWINDPIASGNYKQISPSNLTFSYYGANYSSLYVNTDGTITFDGPSAEYQDAADWTQSPPARPRIAPLWDFFDIYSEPYDVYWQVKDDGLSTERLIVQWSGMNPSSDQYSGPNETVTFQAVLYANGDIRFNYQDLDLTDGNFAEGRNAIVGISGDRFLAPDTVPAGVFVDGVHQVESTDFYGAEDDFVRLAWETGGAAWNNDIISGGGSNYATYGEAFDAAFIESISRQILDKHARGDVAFADDPLIEINMGGPAVGNYIADTNPILGGNFLSSGSTTLSTMQTIVKNGNSMAGDANTLAVFQDAREWSSPGGELNLPSTLVPNGRYVVELMFANIPDDGVMSVTLEGASEPVLREYYAWTDFGKIPTGASQGPEYEVLPDTLTDYTPIVKRFSVDVADGNGLTITLDGHASINGLRVLKTPPPRVKDVVVKGSTWAEGVEHSFQELISLGQQLRSLAMQGADTIEIHFDGPVNISSGAALTLNRTVRNSSGSVTNTSIAGDAVGSAPGQADDVQFNYDSANYVARWKFPTVAPAPGQPDLRLLDGKYAIHLSGVTGGAGQLLDGDWDNNIESPLTLDTFGDDPGRAFLTGDGIPGSSGSAFRFHFALLAGDYDGDGFVEHSGESVAGDGNGDGVVDAADTSIGANGTLLPLQKLGGADFNDDEIVNSGDYAIWRNGFGGTAAGDVDGDGDTDGNDFLLWQRVLGTQSAWYMGTGGASSTLVGDFAPRVMNVIVSGSTSTHAPYSFDTVDGSGTQLKTVPVGGADTISIVFSEDVNVSAELLILVGLRTAHLPEVAAFSYDAATHTATWRFENWTLGDNYLLALSDMVTDVDGNWLDGEWTNPASVTTVNAAVSEFPSGDGAPGGWFNFALTVLTGDGTGDNIVDSGDHYLWLARVNDPNYDIGATFADGDMDGDGDVDQTDYNLGYVNAYLNLSTLWLRADFDGDGDVDDDDILVIALNGNMTGATWADGDLDGDGEVTEDDLDLAMAQYGLGISVVS